jgi:hypothetical protein
MAMYVMHGVAVKFLTVFRGTLAARWQRPAIAFAKVKMMIDVSVETIRPVEPRSHADEDSA